MQTTPEHELLTLFLSKVDIPSFLSNPVFINTTLCYYFTMKLGQRISVMSIHNSCPTVLMTSLPLPQISAIPICKKRNPQPAITFQEGYQYLFLGHLSSLHQTFPPQPISPYDSNYCP